MPARICTGTLESLSPYGQSRYYSAEFPKKEKESPQAYEERTWRYRTHANEKDEVFIPPSCFKNLLSQAAKFLSMQIPGEGKKTFTKHFESGVLCTEPLMLGIKRADVHGTWLHLPSNGQRGGGKRVLKCMPEIPTWKGKVQFIVIDDKIPRDVFEYHVEQAGTFIGIGFFRPMNNGWWGRFKATKFEWSTLEG